MLKSRVPQHVAAGTHRSRKDQPSGSRGGGGDQPSGPPSGGLCHPGRRRCGLEDLCCTSTRAPTHSSTAAYRGAGEEGDGDVKTSSPPPLRPMPRPTSEPSDRLSSAALAYLRCTGRHALTSARTQPQAEESANSCFVAYSAPRRRGRRSAKAASGSGKDRIKMGALPHPPECSNTTSCCVRPHAHRARGARGCSVS